MAVKAFAGQIKYPSDFKEKYLIKVYRLSMFLD
jgi:hypothetical protein